MNISEAQEKYDNQNPYDNECEECENHIRRGDELFDNMDTLQREPNHLEEQYGQLADRLRERDELIAKYVSRFGVLETEE